jgi:segregation and condensation protein A
MILPKEVNEEGEEEDPRADLVEKLLEYKMYKYMAYELRDRQMDADMSWFRQKNLPKEVREYEMPIDFSDLIGDATLSKLNSIFQELLRRQEDKVDPIRSKFGNIEKEEVDMDAKTLYIRAYIREHKRFSFRQLLEKQASKTEIVVTFLVMLEEIKLGEIEIEQDTTFGDIIITSRKAG